MFDEGLPSSWCLLYLETLEYLASYSEHEMGKIHKW